MFLLSVNVDNTCAHRTGRSIPLTRMTMQMEKENNSAANLQELQAGMERLERREWWRWAAALVIMLLLTLSVFSLSLPGMGKDTSKEDQLGVAVRGLFALVLLFDVFAIYQQVLITRMR